MGWQTLLTLSILDSAGHVFSITMTQLLLNFKSHNQQANTTGHAYVSINLHLQNRQPVRSGPWTAVHRCTAVCTLRGRIFVYLTAIITVPKIMPGTQQELKYALNE